MGASVGLPGPASCLGGVYVADVDGQRREAKIGNDLPNSRR
jgi:hypothetical protein